MTSEDRWGETSMPDEDEGNDREEGMDVAKELDRLAALREEILAEADRDRDAPGVGEVGTWIRQQGDQDGDDARVASAEPKWRAPGGGRRAWSSRHYALAAAVLVVVVLAATRPLWWADPTSRPEPGPGGSEILLSGAIQQEAPVETDVAIEFRWHDSESGPGDRYRVTVRSETGEKLQVSPDLEEASWIIGPDGWSPPPTWEEWRAAPEYLWEVSVQRGDAAWILAGRARVRRS